MRAEEGEPGNEASCASVPDYETWYTGTQYHSNVPHLQEHQALKTNVYAYNLVVLVFLTMRLGTLVHNTTLMSKPLNKFVNNNNKQPKAIN